MANENEFKISREFNAPRELLFEMWTNPQHLNNWWGPAGMNASTKKLDLKPGGIFHYFIESPDGFTLYGRFIYKEIIRPEKLVFIVSFSDKEEGIARHPLAPTWPAEMLSTIIFTEQNGKTILEMSAIPINASEEEIKTFVEGFPSMNEGWGGTFSKLMNYLPVFAPINEN